MVLLILLFNYFKPTNSFGGSGLITGKSPVKVSGPQSTPSVELSWTVYFADDSLKAVRTVMMAVGLTMALAEVFGAHFCHLILSPEWRGIQMVVFQMFQIGKFQKPHRK